MIVTGDPRANNWPCQNFYLFNVFGALKSDCTVTLSIVLKFK